MNKSTKFLSVMAVLMPAILLISSVFNDELVKSGYYIYFAIFGVIILILGALSVILYYISKKRK
jgi:Mg2+ and Co2+ transporter CorA